MIVRAFSPDDFNPRRRRRRRRRAFRHPRQLQAPPPAHSYTYSLAEARFKGAMVVAVNAASPEEAIAQAYLIADAFVEKARALRAAAAAPR